MPSWDKPPEDPYKDNPNRNQRWQGFDPDSTDVGWWTSCCVYELLWSIFGGFGCFGSLIALAIWALLV